ncbi:MAG: polymer-forming cytoskeletal protein, partial [Parafilimonas sp.]
KIKGNVRSDEKVDVIKKGEIDGNVFAPEINVDEESLVKGSVTKLTTANTSDELDGNAELSESITPIMSDKPGNEEEKPQSWF